MVWATWMATANVNSDPTHPSIRIRNDTPKSSKQTKNHFQLLCFCIYNAALITVTIAFIIRRAAARVHAAMFLFFLRLLTPALALLFLSSPALLLRVLMWKNGKGNGKKQSNCSALSESLSSSRACHETSEQFTHYFQLGKTISMTFISVWGWVNHFYISLGFWDGGRPAAIAEYINKRNNCGIRNKEVTYLIRKQKLLIFRRRKTGTEA